MKKKEQKQSELSKCQEERDEYLNGWKRAQADLINYKKETGEQAEALIRMANEVMARELLIVLDSMELALKVDKKNTGLKQIKGQLEKVLKKVGLEEIKTLGEKFDPNLHEAIMEVEVKEESGIIIEEIEKGFKLYEKIVRPAKVKISK